MWLLLILKAKYTDILCVNRYYGWYDDTGALETIPYKLSNDLTIWHNLFKKPIIMTEYGADTVPGQHTVCYKKLNIRNNQYCHLKVIVS